jgi:hypothetical protein
MLVNIQEICYNIYIFLTNFEVFSRFLGFFIV